MLGIQPRDMLNLQKDLEAKGVIDHIDPVEWPDRVYSPNKFCCNRLTPTKNRYVDANNRSQSRFSENCCPKFNANGAINRKMAAWMIPDSRSKKKADDVNSQLDTTCHIDL